MKDAGESCSCRARVTWLREGAAAEERGWSGEKREEETGESTSGAVACRRVARWCSRRARRCAAERVTSAAAEKGSEAPAGFAARGVRARAACRHRRVEKGGDM